jgi:hypothetical protein
VQASSLADLQATLETQRQELHEERRKFTEAAVRLGKERAEIEVRLPLPLFRPEHREAYLSVPFLLMTRPSV